VLHRTAAYRPGALKSAAIKADPLQKAIPATPSGSGEISPSEQLTSVNGVG
jgi:hypothetical protein